VRPSLAELGPQVAGPGGVALFALARLARQATPPGFDDAAGGQELSRESYSPNTAAIITSINNSHSYSVELLPDWVLPILPAKTVPPAPSL
jgi:hypothetical protein